MRYVLLLFALSALMVVAIAGKRGERSRRPPIEIFPDMDRQPKLRPQTVNAFFKDRLTSTALPATAPPVMAGASLPNTA
jgi:hypothetical protein